MVLLITYIDFKVRMNWAQISALKGVYSFYFGNYSVILKLNFSTHDSGKITTLSWTWGKFNNLFLKSNKKWYLLNIVYVIVEYDNNHTNVTN